MAATIEKLSKCRPLLCIARFLLPCITETPRRKTKHLLCTDVDLEVKGLNPKILQSLSSAFSVLHPGSFPKPDRAILKPG